MPPTTRRPKYACRRCAQSVAQAHAPKRLIARIIVSKFGDHFVS